jgi:hypothetical protein
MWLTILPYFKVLGGRATAQAVSRRPLTAEAQVHARVNIYGICRGQSDTGTGFSPSSSALPCQYHPPSLSTNIYHQGDDQ